MIDTPFAQHEVVAQIGDIASISISNWPTAVVVLAIILAPQVLSWINAAKANSRAKRAEETGIRVEDTLTKNNGGGSVKDSLDRIEKRQDEQGKTLDTVVKTQKEQTDKIATLSRTLDDHLALGDGPHHEAG